MPARRQRSRSPSIACAVIAMIGTRVAVALAGADPRGGLVAVDVRHLAVHEHRERGRGREHGQRLAAVLGEVDRETRACAASPRSRRWFTALSSATSTRPRVAATCAAPVRAARPRRPAPGRRRAPARVRRPPRRPPAAAHAGPAWSGTRSTPARASGAGGRPSRSASPARHACRTGAGAHRARASVETAHLGHLVVEHDDSIRPPVARRGLEHRERRRRRSRPVADGDARRAGMPRTIVAVGRVVVDDEHAQVLGQRAPRRRLGRCGRRPAPSATVKRNVLPWPRLATRPSARRPSARRAGARSPARGRCRRSAGWSTRRPG